MGDDGLPSADGAGARRGKLALVVKLEVAKQIHGKLFQTRKKIRVFFFKRGRKLGGRGGGKRES